MTVTDEQGSPPLTKRDFEALARFRFGIRRYLRFSEETVRSRGVTPAQYQLLLALKGSPDRDWATVRELAAGLQLRHHSVVELVDRVQQQGLVHRATEPADARVVRVVLTPEGDRLLAQLSALHRDELRRMGSAFAPADLDGAHDSVAHRIVNHTQDAVVHADRDGIISLWNTGAEIVFGHPASHALGQSLDLIIPEKQRQRHWEGWQRVMETGETKYGREPLAVPGLRADGSRLSLEFSITMLHDADGRVAGIAAIIRDVTARWEEDRALRRRLAALEKEASARTTPTG